MNEKSRDPDRPSRWRLLGITLAFALACVAAAAITVGDILRDPSPHSPAPRGPSPLLSAVNRAEIADEPGMYRVDGQLTLGAKIEARRAAEQGAQVVAEIPAGTVVDLVARRSGWTLIAWPSGAGGVLIGWVVLPKSP